MSEQTRTIEIEGSDWQTRDDFYEALNQALGSFEGHGRNADAFLETMIYLTELNREQPPYRLVLVGASQRMLPFLREFSSWVDEAKQDRINDPEWGDHIEVEVVIK